MTTLAAALTNSATEMRVNAAVADPAEYYTIDSEVIRVLANSTTVQDGLSPERSVDTTLWQIQRGHGPTAAASHLSGATLTPFPGAGGGAAALSFDNTIDPPTDITSLVAAGGTVVGSEATLRGKDFYAQDDDPGAVGTGSVWKDTDAAPEQWWRRNVADDGWEPDFSPFTTAVGSEPASVSSTANAVDGTATAASVAGTTGAGNADARPWAVSGGGLLGAAGTGAALAGSRASSDDGIADAGATATTTGEGPATVLSVAEAEDTGSATAGSYATRQATTAGMYAEVDDTGVAKLGFNAVAASLGIPIPVIPAVPTEQDIADVLVALGLATQTP